MSDVLAIDPGNVQSGWVRWSSGRPIRFGKHPNDRMLAIIDAELVGWAKPVLAIERIKSYGMIAGESLFETCVWTGRMIQRWLDSTGQDIADVDRVERLEVKKHLGVLGKSYPHLKSADSKVRQAIMDRFGSDKATAIGTKAAPGPLYGVAGDVWAAIGVALTAAEPARA